MQNIKVYLNKFYEKSAFERKMFWYFMISHVWILGFMSISSIDKVFKILMTVPVFLSLFTWIALWLKIAPSGKRKPSTYFEKYDVEQRKIIFGFYQSHILFISSIILLNYFASKIGLVLAAFFSILFLKDLYIKTLEEVIQEHINLKVDPDYYSPIHNDDSFKALVTAFIILVVVVIGLVCYQRFLK